MEGLKKQLNSDTNDIKESQSLIVVKFETVFSFSILSAKSQHLALAALLLVKTLFM